MKERLIQIEPSGPTAPQPASAPTAERQPPPAATGPLHRWSARYRRIVLWALSRRMPLRAAGVSGLLVPVTIGVGYIAGALAQPDAYSSADDDTSDLGALTANMAWIQNQIGANLSGILIILLGLGLWRALSPDVLGRIGAGTVMLTGLGTFADGFLRLDCRGIDPGCTNESWHAAAHKMNNRFLFVAFAAALILAFAFRRIPEWRGAWLPSLLVVPALMVSGALFSGLGDGASQRAANLTLFAWVAFLGARMLRTANARRVETQ